MRTWLIGLIAAASVALPQQPAPHFLFDNTMRVDCFCAVCRRAIDRIIDLYAR